MRALLLDRPGDPETLRLGEAEIPEPESDQVRIRVEACGLNPVDAGLVKRGHPDWAWPHIPGLDVAGVIDGVGHGLPSALIGQRVAAHHDLRQPGALAQFVVVDATALARIPEGVDSTAAAALPCAGMTAFQSVFDRLHVKEGDTVLVTGGSGGVGGFAVQLAASASALVIATAALEYQPVVRQLGAHHLIDHRTEDVSAAVKELTQGRGVDAIVDTVSSTSATEKLSLLAHGGGIACVAGRADYAALPSFTTAPSVHEIALGAAYSHGDHGSRVRLSEMLTDLLGRAAAGTLDPMVTKVVTLEEAAPALAARSTGSPVGKLVVRV